VIDLPIIKKNAIKYGIKPTTKNFGRRIVLCGFDTEFMGTNIFDKENELLTIQISTKNENWISPFDYKKREYVKSGIHNLDLFPNNAFVGAHNLQVDLGAMLGSDIYACLDAETENKKLSRGDTPQKVGGWKFAGSIGGVSGWAIFEKKEKDHIRRLTFTDTGNWFGHIRLESIAKAFVPDAPKMQKPSFLGLRGPKNYFEAEYFKEYALQDSYICYKLMEIIKDFHMFGDVKQSVTPASLSASRYRKNYLEKPLYYGDFSQLHFIWQTYHGGRFEAFNRGTVQNIKVYDINSLYPFSAVNTALPFSTNTFYHTSEIRTNGWYKVAFLFKDRIKYPCLPTLHYVNTISFNDKGAPEMHKVKKLIFPQSGISFCSGHELKLALPYLESYEILDGLSWDLQTEDIDHSIKKYMLDFYERKEEIDAKKIRTERDLIERSYIKLMMNAFIGKLAERRNKGRVKEREIAGKMFYPPFASLILGKARTTIAEALLKSPEVFYCDTDSLAVKGTLPESSMLGALKLEAKGNACFIRGKLYFITDENREMGTPLQEKEKLVKKGKHGFRIAGEKAYTLFINSALPYVDYVKFPFVTTIKQSRREHAFFNKFTEKKFRIGLTEDGKRLYEQNLQSPRELLENCSPSVPIQIPVKCLGI